jgi:hypothetical protein
MEDLGMNSAMINLNNSMTKAGWFYFLITGRYSVTRLENFGIWFFFVTHFYLSPSILVSHIAHVQYFPT